MKNMWKKHTIGKRILALCLLVTMLFDTVTASAITFDEESTQIDVVEETTELEETSKMTSNLEVVASETGDIKEEASEAILGAFENVNFTFYGYTAQITGSYRSSEDYASHIYFVCYDSEGEELSSNWIGTCEANEVLEFMDCTSQVYGNYTAKVGLYAMPVDSFVNVDYVYTEGVDFVYEQVPLGEFQDIDILFMGYEANIKDGVFNATGDYSCGIYFVCYNEEGEVLDSSLLEICDAKSQFVFSEWGFARTVPEGTAYVQLEAQYNGESIEIEKACTEKINFAYAPITMGTFEDVKIQFSGYSAQIQGTFVPNFTDEVFDIQLVSYNDANEKLCSESIVAYDGTVVLGSGYSYRIGTVAKGVSYVRLEASPVDSGLDIETTCSEKFYRIEEPNFSFVIEDVKPGAGSLLLSVNYDGDLAAAPDYLTAFFDAEFIYGTSEDPSTWGNIQYTNFSISEDYKGDVCFASLEPETAFYGKVRLYSALYDEITGEYFTNYEQTILLEPFETEEVINYNLKTAFPDAVLRDWVIYRINRQTGADLTEDSEVTNTQLEGIAGSLYLEHDNLAKEPIRDITGIDLLTNVTKLYLRSNEIENVDNIDWSKLAKLEELDIAANNITKFPDLSKNEKLTYVSYSDNMLSAEELKTVKDKLPVCIENYTPTDLYYQRSALLELRMEEKYYVYGSAVPFVAKAKGQKNYTAKLFIDGVECASSPNWYKDLYIEDTGLAVGEHTARVELYNGDVKVRETEEQTFYVVEENVFVENDIIYLYCEENYFYPDFYATKPIADVSVVDDSGSTYYTTYATRFTDTWGENRYENKDLHLEGYYLNWIGYTLKSEYDVLPVGTYHIQVEFTDGTSEILRNKVQIVGKGQAFYQGAYISNKYAVNSEEYLYITLEGYNLEPDKFDYVIMRNGIELPVTYIEAKEEGYGQYTVKLKREGWQKYKNYFLDLLITPKAGYEVPGDFRQISDYESGELAAFVEYNDVIDKLEIVLNEKYLNQTVSVKIREDWDEDTYPVVASGSAKVTDEITFVDLHNADGSKFNLKNYSYICEVSVGDEVYENWIYRQYSMAHNYWDRNYYITEKTGSTVLYFYSDIPYSEYGNKPTNFSVEVEGEGIEYIGAIKVNTSSWDKDCTRIAITIVTRNLPLGSYTVRLYDGEVELDSTPLWVHNAKHFILDAPPFAAWVNESEMKVQLVGANLFKSVPTVTLYDEDGNVVTGITQKISYRDSYDDFLVLTLNGLNRSEADDKYYIKVSGRRLEGPYQRNGELYYSNEDVYGELISIYRYPDVAFRRSEKGLTGISVSKDMKDAVAEKPLIIRIYKPYDMDVLKEIVVSDSSQFRYDKTYFSCEYRYFFNKNFWESLPNRDATYEVVVECDGEILESYTSVLGYEEWYYSVDREELYLDSKGAKTATLSVKNYAEIPTIMSSDTSIAKLTISEDNPGEVTITALKMGTTEITITADGITKSFTLTVKNLPKVKAKSSVVLNSFFDTSRADLEITNSWDTEVTSVYMTESIDGLDIVQTVDGKWYLRWYKEEGAIPKDTKITLHFAVEGYSETEEDPLPTQIITVNTKSTQPTTVLSEDVVEFKAYPYKDKKIDFTVKNSDYSGGFALNPSDVVLSKAPEGIDIENPGVSAIYDEISGKLLVTASNDAENGVYEFVITPTVEDNSEDVKRARPAILKVKLSGKEPAFTFNTSTVTLDAAYPGESEGSIKLLMDEGYVVEEAIITAPNKDVEDFIRVESNKDGTFTFKLEKLGIASAGTYKIKVKVKASWGTVYEMKPLDVTVKVTNSSKVTLSSKSKSVTINQNVGSAEVNANLAVKGFAKQSSVDYTTDYEFVPVNELAKNASIGFEVDDNGTIQITDCKGYGDGKYTYNLVGIIAGTDGTVTYTKPLAFTVQLQAKSLTIVPARSSVTVYSEYCAIKNGCYVVEIPVSVKESSAIKLDAPLTNSMEDKDVFVEFSRDGSKIIVEFPTKMDKVSNLTITPTQGDVRFGAFKVSITVKKIAAKAAFSEKIVTLNRYTDEKVENTVVDTEGYVIDSLTSIVIKDKKKKDVTDQFVVNTDRNILTISIASDYIDSITNGEYTVSVVPKINIDDNMEPKVLAACTFKLKLTQPSLKVSIGELKKATMTVNLYPTLGELVSDAFEMNVYSGDEPLTISRVEVTNNDKKKVVAEARVDDENRIILSALEDETGLIKNGKNTFSVVAYVKNANGEKEIKVDSALKQAFVVNVRDLPTSIKFAKTKLTYSPYIESNVTTTINSAELEALMETGDYSYVISAEETTSKYKELAEDKKNRILEVSGDEDGEITVDNVGIPTKNATYYYKVTVDFIQNDTGRVVASYPMKMSVSVKNTLPKANLQMNSISLDNAFVKQEVANKVILSTGTGLWKLDALSDMDIIVKSGKKDVTSEGYFDISYDGTGFNVSLNNRDVNDALMTVPKGTYKIEITPKISEKTVEAEEGLKSALKPLTLTVKVTSSRPTVKLASKVTIKAGDEAKILEPTLKNKGTITDMTVECKPPKKATEADVDGMDVALLEDGMISIKAEKDVLPGSYKFTITPVTKIDGEEILLAPITITVTVKK